MAHSGILGWGSCESLPFQVQGRADGLQVRYGQHRIGHCRDEVVGFDPCPTFRKRQLC